MNTQNIKLLIVRLSDYKQELYSTLEHTKVEIEERIDPFKIFLIKWIAHWALRDTCHRKTKEN